MAAVPSLIHSFPFPALTTSSSSYPPPPPQCTRTRTRTLTLTLKAVSSPPSLTPTLTPSHTPTPFTPPSSPLPNFISLIRLALRHHHLPLLRALHALLLKLSPPDDLLLPTNHLISAYASLGLLTHARNLLDAMPHPNVVSFSLLISAYAHHPQPSPSHSSLRLFHRMRHLGIHPNSFSLVALLTYCIRTPNPLLGPQLHALALKSSLHSSLHVSNALLAMYAKLHATHSMLSLFHQMSHRDTSSWNAIFLGLLHDRRYQEAFHLFFRMRMDGLTWDHYSLSTLLTAATDAQDVLQGQVIHACAIKSGLELDMVVSTALLAFYRNHGSIDDMLDLFNRMPTKDITAWNAMLNGFLNFGLIDSAVEVLHKMPERDSITFNSLLAGFCKNGEGKRALNLFLQMYKNRIPISDYTIIGCISAVAITGDRKNSEQIHSFVIKCGCKLGPRIQSALIDMCAKCGRTEDAYKLFMKWSHKEDFNIAFTSILSSYVRDGHPEKTLNHFISCSKELEPSISLFMDEFVMATVIGACGALGFGGMGQQMHCLATKYGMAYADPTIGNAIVSMYARCGNLEHAQKVFDQMHRLDQVSWNALMDARLLYGQGDRVLDLWSEMKQLGFKPDALTFVLVISACRYTGYSLIDTCNEIFSSMKNLYNIEPSDEHYAAMIEVLGFWGNFDEVEKLISNIPFRPTALIWRSLLDICRLKSNPALEKMAVQNLLALEPEDESTFILAANLYAASSRWYCSEKVREEMRSNNMQKIPVSSWLIHSNMVHRFYTRDRTHPQSKDIYSGLDVLILECMKNGYEPDTRFVLHEVEEYQKKHFLLYHSAKLAVMYGILVTEQGEVVRVMKNVRLCGDCHSFIKLASFLTGREILVRDTKGFHVFRNGECSCRNRW